MKSRDSVNCLSVNQKLGFNKWGWCAFCLAIHLSKFSERGEESEHDTDGDDFTMFLFKNSCNKMGFSIQRSSHCYRAEGKKKKE